MALYQIQSSGVLNTSTLQHVTPADYVEWQLYQDWLAAGNVPDPQLVITPYSTLAAMRVEMFARLDAVIARRLGHGTMSAAGHTWRITARFWLAVVTHRAAMPPIPPGFTLPDSSGIQVPINNALLNDLVLAFSARAIALNARYAVLRSAINASGTPLAIDLEIGWPP